MARDKVGNMPLLNQIKSMLEELWNHRIVEQGTSGIWTYRKYADGTAECWAEASWTVSFVSWGNWGGYSNIRPEISFPGSLFIEAPKVIASSSNGGWSWCINSASSATGAYFYIGTDKAGTQNVKFNIHAIGKWK